MPKDLYFFLIPLVITGFGIFCCFWGYGLFRFTLVLLGFFAGIYAVLTYGSGLITDKNILIIIAIALGIIIGILILAFYYVGIFLSGCIASYFVINYLGLRFDYSEKILIIAGICLLGGVLSLIFQRFMIILATGVIGSFCTINGIGYLIFLMKYGKGSFNKYLNTIKLSSDFYYLLLFVVSIIALCGIIFQLKMIPESTADRD